MMVLFLVFMFFSHAKHYLCRQISITLPLLFPVNHPGKTAQQQSGALLSCMKREKCQNRRQLTSHDQKCLTNSFHQTLPSWCQQGSESLIWHGLSKYWCEVIHLRTTVSRVTFNWHLVIWLKETEKNRFSF